MQTKVPRKAMRSKSPGQLNKMFHSNHKLSNGVEKKHKASNNILKVNVNHNISKMSYSSSKSILKSRSMQTLPPIPGNDLKMIKYIFEQAKKYRNKLNQMQIPIKKIPRSTMISPKSIKPKKSPKIKQSSSTIRSLSNNSYKLEDRKDKSTNLSHRIGKPSSFLTNKCQSNPVSESSAHLPEIIKETPAKSAKCKSKEKHKPSKFKYIYKVKGMFYSKC